MIMSMIVGFFHRVYSFKEKKIFPYLYINLSMKAWLSCYEFLLILPPFQSVTHHLSIQFAKLHRALGNLRASPKNHSFKC